MLFSLPTLRTSIAGKARSYTSNATATAYLINFNFFVNSSLYYFNQFTTR